MADAFVNFTDNFLHLILDLVWIVWLNVAVQKN